MAIRVRLRTLFAAVACVAAVFAYIVAYTEMLEPTIIAEQTAGGVAVGYREPSFRLNNELSLIFFAPLVAIDQRIRPEYWNNWSTLEDANNGPN